MKTIFSQGIYINQALIFVRENYIRNTSLALFEDENKSGSDYFIKLCEDTQANYIEIRKDIPTLLKRAEAFINDIESDNMCSTIYPS